MCPLWILFILIIKSTTAGLNLTGVQKMVVNGVEVIIEQYPYLAQVIIDQTISCGGAIVSHRVIATAGHCVYDIDQETMTSAIDIDIYLGSSYTMQGTHYDVCKVLKHPKYGNAEQYYYYDIALLLLSKTIKLSRKVQIATIAPSHKWRNVKHTMNIAGFGYIYNTEDLPNQMYATRMHYVDTKICSISQTGEGDYMPVPEHMFCMVGSTFTSDCFGDSGSPITWRMYIVGLVSHGRDNSCGSEAMPSLYTDLTYFKSWIMEKVKQLESTSKAICDEVKRQKQIKEKQRHEKQKENKKKQSTSKLMNLVPISKNINTRQIFSEAWPIFRPPFS